MQLCPEGSTPLFVSSLTVRTSCYTAIGSVSSLGHCADLLRARCCFSIARRCPRRTGPNMVLMCNLETTIVAPQNVRSAVRTALAKVVPLPIFRDLQAPEMLRWWSASECQNRAVRQAQIANRDPPATAERCPSPCHDRPFPSLLIFETAVHA